MTITLRDLFAKRGLTVCAGMDWLQDEGLVSDECVMPEDVALVDAARVLAMFGGSDK